MSSKTTIYPLTSLRFLAAAWVLVFHVRPFDPFFARPFIRPLLDAGWLGVSIFFVLSGFILSYNYLDRGVMDSVQSFWMSRFARIYPVYALGLILSAPFVIRDVLQRHIPAAVLFAAPLLLQAWSPRLKLLWNAPGWTLSSEAFFYLVFPATAFWINRVRSNFWLTTGGLWLISLIAFITQCIVGQKTPNIAEQLLIASPIGALPTFLIGVAIGIRYLSTPKRDGDLLVIVGFLGFFSCILFSIWLPFSLVDGGLLAPFFALIIYGLASGGNAARWLSRPWLILLGEASYSIYILQSPIASWMMHFLKHRQWQSVGMVVACVYCTVVIVIAIVSYRFIEVPARRKLLDVYRRLRAPEPIPAQAAS